VCDEQTPKELPQGLCGNRAEHEAHQHDSKSFGLMWCHADQSKRLPYAMEKRTK
jgi:hypothetical protein